MPEGAAQDDRSRQSLQALYKYLSGRRLLPVDIFCFVTISEVADHDTGDARQRAGQLEVGQQPIDTVRELPHLFEKEHCAIEIGLEGRA